MPADKCVKILDEKLNEFGVSLQNDIVAIVTDGASIMKKVGKLISASHQLCFAHAIQLGVIDTIYKKCSNAETLLSEIDESNNADNSDDNDDTAESDFDDDDGQDIEVRIIYEFLTKNI